MEDRPKRIKAEVFPYDDVDCESGLAALEKSKFIVRYEIDGTRYLQVVNFEKHQNCNVKEAESTIPAPYGHSAVTVQAPEEHSTVGKEGKGKEGKGEDARGVVLNGFKPPTKTECREKAKMLGGDAQAGEDFWLHYDSVGWKVGGNAMVNWQSRLQKWLNGDKAKPKTGTRSHLDDIPEAP